MAGILKSIWRYLLDFCCMGARQKRKIYTEYPERRIMRRQKLKTKVHLCVLLGDRGMEKWRTIYVDVCMQMGHGMDPMESGSVSGMVDRNPTRKGMLVSIHLTWPALGTVSFGPGCVLVCAFPEFSVYYICGHSRYGTLFKLTKCSGSQYSTRDKYLLLMIDLRNIHKGNES